ncbi:MAG: UDP-N-acetylmuramoyl-L-alanyl-D-glutamate--2,6-diaminopimelate ligase, partial [Halobacteriovoraceae bacterium]|nr:UDP-N-acetylmuramoyl-L-alanyl-D-glutamate--2,6-diaminopimelate ligase [Halobacteriovoraceae bacterium]
LQKNKNFCLIHKKNFLSAQKKILDILYPLSQTPIIAGITGTNGKTTVTALATQIAAILGKKALGVGTLGVIDAKNDCIYPLQTTTPSYIELRKILYKFKNTQVFFLETSSHGLCQNRLFDLKLKTCAWTNFTQDHLDYHKDMDSYFLSKLKIIDHLEDNGVLNIPTFEHELFEKIKGHHRVKKAKSLSQYSLTHLPKPFKLQFNQNNLELSLALNEQIWGSLPSLDLKSLSLPKGRFTSIKTKKGTVIIDYAHTPAAIENITQAIKSYFTPKKLSIVFGCGGNRDFSKRAVMGEIACKNADFIYLTSDNPRTESPEKIIEDIKKGCLPDKISCETDRKKAIESALKNMTENEILLIAGKGHEDYQELSNGRIYFSDFKIVEDFSRRNDDL